MIGLGIDLCRVERIERAMKNPRFLLRAFTEGEREKIARRGAQTAAGCFAAKEAVAKALGSGFDGFFMDKIEVVWDERGRPGCRLSAGALSRLNELGGKSVHLSITHESGVAAAVAVIE